MTITLTHLKTTDEYRIGVRIDTPVNSNATYLLAYEPITKERYDMMIENVNDNFFCGLRAVVITEDSNENRTVTTIREKYVTRYDNQIIE